MTLAIMSYVPSWARGAVETRKHAQSPFPSCRGPRIRSSVRGRFTSLSPGNPLPQVQGPADRSAAATGGPSAFDVVSVHEHSSDDHRMSWMTKDDGLSTVNLPLKSLIAMAYNVKTFLITGAPAWVNTKGFDVEAKVLPGDAGTPVKLTEAQTRVVLRALLADRFHLQAHLETETLPVYDLVVAKGGPKVQPPTPNPTEDAKNEGRLTFGPGYLEALLFTVPAFAEQLGYMVDRSVIDKTGLTGKYNFTLNFTPDNQLGTASDKASTGTDPKPSIYTAIQEQLGLKLVPSKGPVDTLVIDHAKLPTAN